MATVTAPAKSSLWRQGRFVGLWTGHSLRITAGVVGKLTLPTIAISALKAGPLQLGILTALSLGPGQVLGPVLGLVVDRIPRRRALVSFPLISAALLLSVWAALYTGHLTLIHLYLVAALLSLPGTAAFIATQSTVPAVVPPEKLVKANGAININNYVGGNVGYALGGWLMSAGGVAAGLWAHILGLCAASVSFTASAPALGPGARKGDSFHRQIWGTLQTVIRDRVLRRLLAASIVGNAGSAIVTANLVVFAYQYLRFSPQTTGLMLGIGALGGGAGVLLAIALSGKLAPAEALILASIVMGCGGVIIADATHYPLLYGAGYFLVSVGFDIVSVNVGTTVQRTVPRGALGRAFGILISGQGVGTTLGGIAGGIVGTGADPQIAIFVGGIVLASTGIVLLGTPKLAATAGTDESGKAEPKPAGAGPVLPRTVTSSLHACTATGCAGTPTTRCAYVDRNGDRCPTSWCPAHLSAVGGQSYCRRHAPIVARLGTANLPPLRTGAASLVIAVGDQLKEPVLTLLEAYANPRARTQTTDKVYGARTKNGSEIWVREWTCAMDHATVSIKLEAEEDADIAVFLGRWLIAHGVPPWIVARARGEVVTPEAAAAQRRNYYGYLLQAISDNLQSLRAESAMPPPLSPG